MLAQSVAAQTPEKYASEEAVEQQFDTIRDFQSYDPATHQWSKIEEFRDVDILESKKKPRENKYIYRSFWAYDAQKSHWYKVDICDHGYQRDKKPIARKNEKKEIRYPLTNFLKNWAIGAKIGGGYCIEQALWKGFTASKSGERILLHNKGEQAYQLLFPSQRLANYRGDAGNALKGNIETHTVSLPTTFFTHYTFFKHVRIGVGGKVELKRFFINSMSSKLPVSDTAEVLNQWINHPAWFGTLGINLVQANDYKIALEIRAGESYVLDGLKKALVDKTGKDVKNIQEELWKQGFQNIRLGYLEKGKLFGAGLSYEQRLDSHWTLVGQLGGNGIIKDKLGENATENESIYAGEVLIHFDLGLQFNPGRTKKDVRSKNKRTQRRRRRR